MIEFAREQLADVQTELPSLIGVHWKETGRHQDIFKCDPSWVTYAQMEELGALRIFTVREEGRLVGYAAYILAEAIHYQGRLYADSDAFFIHPEARKGYTASNFFKYIEEELRNDNVDLIINKVKEKYGRVMGRFFENLGYEKAEVVYTKLVR